MIVSCADLKPCMLRLSKCVLAAAAIPSLAAIPYRIKIYSLALRPGNHPGANRQTAFATSSEHSSVICRMSRRAGISCVLCCTCLLPPGQRRSQPQGSRSEPALPGLFAAWPCWSLHPTPPTCTAPKSCFKLSLLCVPCLWFSTWTTSCVHMPPHTASFPCL